MEDIKEKLAAIEHERWADWQKWCHHVLRNNLGLNGPNLELEKVLLRWDKQIATPYAELSDKEKASDMEQVDRYWPLITELINQELVKARKDIDDKIVANVKRELRHIVEGDEDGVVYSLEQIGKRATKRLNALADTESNKEGMEVNES